MFDETTLELTIERLAPSGEGVARKDGVVVFVRRGLPGDRVRVAIRTRARRHAHADLLEVLVPGPGRVNAPCTHADACGGCPWMALDPSHQREAKRSILSDTLRRIGRLDSIPEVELISGPTLGYRTRAEWLISHAAGSCEVGYRADRSHQMVAVEDCPILVFPLRDRLRALRVGAATLPADTHTIQICADDVVGARLSAEDRGGRAIAPADDSEVARRTVLGHPVDWPVRGFQQGNADLLDALVTVTLEALPRGRVLDLFCGAGLFSLAYALTGGAAIGVESHPASVAAAEANAARLGVDERCRFVRADVSRWLASGTPRPAAVLVDPPRAGLGQPLVERLLRLGAPHLRHVSCDAVTLARDVGSLVRGGYGLTRVVLVDQFPHTPHIEAVVALER